MLCIYREYDSIPIRGCNFINIVAEERPKTKSSKLVDEKSRVV